MKLHKLVMLTALAAVGDRVKVEGRTVAANTVLASSIEVKAE